MGGLNKGLSGVISPDLRTYGKGNNLDKIFKNMHVVDKATILEKIHKMGLSNDIRPLQNGN